VVKKLKRLLMNITKHIQNDLYASQSMEVRGTWQTDLDHTSHIHVAATMINTKKKKTLCKVSAQDFDDLKNSTQHVWTTCMVLKHHSYKKNV